MKTHIGLVLRLARSASLAPVLAAVVATASCGSVTEPTLTRWEGSLEPVLPSTVSGRVAAVSQFGRTRTSIQIERGEEGVTYLWHLALGDCPGSGGIRGGVAVYPQLIPGETGTASGETTLSSELPSGSAFVARVSRSTPDGTDPVVACADLLELP